MAYGAHFDLEKILGLSSADAQLTLTERSGRDITNDRLTDPRMGSMGSSAQEIYGRGQTWRITQMWYRQKFFDDALDIKLGRVPVGDDFDATGCTFQNNAFCGSLAGHGADVWYNWPVSQWGIRVRYNVHPQWYVIVGAFEYNPTLLEAHNGFKLNTSGREGTLYVAEFGGTPLWNGKLGSYKVGGYYNTADINDKYEDINGDLQPLTGLPFRSHDAKYGYYAYAKQQFTQPDSAHPLRGVSLWIHGSVNDKRTASNDYQMQVGLDYIGLFNSRISDDLGIGLSAMHANNRVVKFNRLKNDLLDVNEYSDSRFTPLRDVEYAAELHYGFKIAEWLTIRPNLQYIANPGGVRNVDNALVAGVQIFNRF